MRILVASKFWYPRGGLERVMFDEIAAMEGRGWEVAHFSTAHPLNVPSPWERYFAPYLELGGGGSLTAGQKAVAAARLFANREAARRFRALAEEFRPDIVHIHGIHRQLSPSMLVAAAHLGIPVVQTLHDYHHVCPADVLLRGGERPCEPVLCGPYDTTSCVRHRCVRGSRAASALSAAETSFQRLRHVYERTVTRFVSPSRFLAEVMAKGGWDRVPIEVVPNGVPASEPRGAGDEGYFLVAGRLSPEKGVGVALEAAKQAGARVVVAGEGPSEEELRSLYADAEFLGRVDSSRVAELMARCRALVVPSIWYENAPMSVLEAMMLGVPVIASRIGGVPEQTEDGRQGMLVPPGDACALAAAMGELASKAYRARAMGEAARERALEDFTLQRHAERLFAVYDAVMAERGRR